MSVEAFIQCVMIQIKILESLETFSGNDCFKHSEKKKKL